MESSTPRRKILVPTDFSRQATQALQHARKLARLFPAEIIVLHVRDEFRVPSLHERDSLAVEVHAVQADAVEQALTRVVEALGQDVCPVRALQVVGSVHAQILRVASFEKVHLIVMGTSGTPADSGPLGSLADRVARTSWLPVTLVRTPRFDGDTRKLGLLNAARA